MKQRLIDFNSLTVREINYIEDQIGPWQDVRRSGHRIQALVWATLHRDNPAFTWEDAEAVEIGEMEYVVDPPADAGPVASANGSRPSATSTAASRRQRSGI